MVKKLIFLMFLFFLTLCHSVGQGSENLTGTLCSKVCHIEVFSPDLFPCDGKFILSFLREVFQQDSTQPVAQNNYYKGARNAYAMKQYSEYVQKTINENGGHMSCWTWFLVIFGIFIFIGSIWADQKN